MIDNRKGDVLLTNEQITRICDRHYGVGSDGLILIETDEDADYHMNFYNPDASQSYCGNGSRCAFAYANSLGMAGDSATFRAIDGMHTAQWEGDNVRISLQNVEQLEDIEGDLLINTGSPHYVRFVVNVLDTDVVLRGRQIRYSDRFSEEGVNVNFVQKVQAGICLRTYERGVENETLSCGTGVTASAIAGAYKWNLPTPVGVESQGGDLLVDFKREGDSFSHVFLSGPAQFVFKGEIEL